MAEDRPFEDLPDAVKRIDGQLADLQSTLLARVARRPTGDIEPTFRSTPKAGSLFLAGQTVSRQTYGGLWDWANDVGAVAAGAFGSGDGSTTFVLPNAAGRMLIGAGTLGADSYVLGAVGGSAWRTITTAQMPSHVHPLSGGGGTAYDGGNHPGHFPAASVMVQSGPDYGVAPWNAASAWSEPHQHNVQTAVYCQSAGGDQPVDNRPPFLVVNWAIWT